MEIPCFLLIRGSLATVPSQSAPSMGCGALSPGLASCSAGAGGIILISKECPRVHHMEVNASVVLGSSDDSKKLLAKSSFWLGSSRGALQSFTV